MSFEVLTPDLQSMVDEKDKDCSNVPLPLKQWSSTLWKNINQVLVIKFTDSSTNIKLTHLTIKNAGASFIRILLASVEEYNEFITNDSSTGDCYEKLKTLVPWTQLLTVETKNDPLYKNKMKTWTKLSPFVNNPRYNNEYMIIQTKKCHDDNTSNSSEGGLSYLKILGHISNDPSSIPFQKILDVSSQEVFLDFQKDFFNEVQKKIMDTKDSDKPSLNDELNIIRVNQKQALKDRLKTLLKVPPIPDTLTREPLIR